MTTHTSELTVTEMADSLTGYEEQAIAKHFGGEMTELMKTKQTMFARALVFVHAARDEHTKVDEAVKVAMEMTLKGVNAYFRDDSEDEVDPVDLETQAGKEPEPSLP